MYSQAKSFPELHPIRFENRALLHAVSHISANLIKRAGVKSGDATYANLLSKIWGQSSVATIEILARRREECRIRKRKTPEFSKEDVRFKAKSGTVSLFEQTMLSDDEKERIRKLKKLNAARDKLVRILRRVKDDTLAVNERRLTVEIINRPGELNVDALRRLWGVPKVVFEVAQLYEYFKSNVEERKICDFYDKHMWSNEPDARVFNILHWKEARQRQQSGKARDRYSSCFRSISHAIIRKVVKLLLTKRRSPLFERNMDVATEVVLYALHPDGHIDSFRESALKAAGFFQGLTAYEYSRSFTGSLQNLHLAKLNRMLKDLRAVKELEAERNNHNNLADGFSLQTLLQYCSERDTLTKRALFSVIDRYVRRENESESNRENLRVSHADFVRLYLSLTGSATDTGLKYWFSVLDQDSDGWISVGDVAYFYSERKAESEKRNGIKLSDVRCLWVRLCAMSRVSPNGKGLSLQALKELGKDEREFVMCALLIRRADDGNLTDVAATLAESDDGSDGSLRLD
ncbi:Serine/threonine-protein phosphatase 2A regulatory subunit B'' subunit beta [Gracilariopsis chorda]|uniref:Serine/threonine-protein phosphatase 2A regulatory subunit B'' subunit beta n=1 Tax=Gracilariopsis chorda TaxID=448386 RepID=A0A2V3IMJ8_9FLOR|nr:Serine/threonine-protein phosphatase 2A regulatory subunit B'' subunit beta [Gracilariopsis chorda]|eukprot:PXF43279.1 Serine/threonine-protein phosphatase 2A regulatory subunit B'' subunit beta [Gracilariopsis chorda]